MISRFMVVVCWLSFDVVVSLVSCVELNVSCVACRWLLVVRGF